MQNGKKTFRCLTSLLLAALLALTSAAAGTASVASAAVNPDDPKWGGIYPLITEDNYATRKPDPEAPAPWGAIPDDAQLYYQEQELAAFIHFGVNTFTGAEWGTGTEKPTVFNPTAMKTQDEADAVAEEWVQAFEDGGFKRIIFVAKHHDGFCLWPSAYTKRDTASSSVPEVDVLLALSKACTKHDMDMGVYLSPWDESDASYGYHDAKGKEITKEQEAALIKDGTLDRRMDYNYYYDLQLREILGKGQYGNKVKYGNNGEFVEIWMDGAKGSGANAQDYDFDMWYKTIKELQPNALCYGNNASSGIHWVGNEAADTDETCWMKFDVTANGELTPTKGSHGALARLQGLANGQVWTITECDVSIRSGWFHGNQHTMDELVQMYYNTAGRGAVWLLNVPPDKSGRFRAEDIAMMKELGDAVKETYATNFASEKMGATAATTMGTERTSAAKGKFSANNVLNDDKDSYWTLQDGATSGQITIDLGKKRTFDLISLQEYIPLGQRIAETRVEYFDDSANTWKVFGETTTVGQRKLVLGNPVTSSKVRVTVKNTTSCTGVPLLRSVGVYKAASVLSKQGLLSSDFTYIDDQSSVFTYAGSWKNETGAEGLENTFKGTGTAGATVTGKFTGTKFYVIGIKGSACGQVEVSIDGETAGVFEAHAPDRMAQQVMYTSPDLFPGEHTVTLTVKTAAYEDGNKTYFNFDGIYYANNENGILEFDRAEYAVNEGGEVTVTVTRTGGSKGEISFDIIDQPSTAVQGQHYDWSSVNKSFTLADGETEATLTAKTFSASESAGAKFYLKIINATGGAVAGTQATTSIQIKGKNDVVLPNPQTPANGESFTASHPFCLPEAEGASAGLEAEYMAGSLPYYAAKAGTYTMTVCYKSSADGTLNWSGSNVEDGSHALPSTAGAGKTVEIPFTVSTAGAGTLTFTPAGGVSIGWIAFRLDSAKYIPATGITLNKNEAALYTNSGHPDHTVKLTASLAPAGASGDLKWSSSDETVATCDQKGLVTAVGNGTATITVTVTNNDGTTFNAQATITVETKIAGVTIKGMAFEGQELKAVLDSEGAAATYEWVRREKRDGTWTTISGATSATYTITKADVGANIFVWATGTDGSLGKVRSGGTALIQDADSYKPATGVTLTPATASLTVGGTAALTATVAPENASVKTVRWKSSDESVVKVSESGDIKALKEGSAVITVTTDDGGFTATCAVTVTAASDPTPDDPAPVIPAAPDTTTTTTTTTNPDGTTTTTVTDNKTGTVTETTKKDDGTVETIETKKDGTKTETTEKPDGTVEVVETKKDGTKTETTKNTDGSTEVVETKPDGTVTATNTDAEGGKVEKVTTPEKDVTITATDVGGEVLAKVEIPNQIPELENRFVDVPEGHWADEAIHNMAAIKVVEGVGNDHFDMSSGMTRGALATVLSRMSNGKEGLKASFADVASDKWYADGIAWAARTGVVTGYSATEFGPEDTITREQLAVMLYRYAALLKLDAKASASTLNEFTDGAKTHSWAVEGMAWCVENGILRGKGNGIIDPRANATRAEAAVMLQRLIDLMK